jgi:hypothetical protein
MCFYIYFAAGEGWRWFNVRKNPFLFLGAAGGVVALAVGMVPSCVSVFTACCGYATVAMLVSVQYTKFGVLAPRTIWTRQLLPVNIPLLCLFYWYSVQC